MRRLSFKGILKVFVLIGFMLWIGSSISAQPAIPQLKGMKEMYRFAFDQLPRTKKILVLAEEDDTT